MGSSKYECTYDEVTKSLMFENKYKKFFWDVTSFRPVVKKFQKRSVYVTLSTEQLHDGTVIKYPSVITIDKKTFINVR